MDHPVTHERIHLQPGDEPESESIQAAEELPYLYDQGAVAAAATTSGWFVWTLIHSHGLQALAVDSYADFLRRSQETGRMADVFCRLPARLPAARCCLPLGLPLPGRPPARWPFGSPANSGSILREPRWELGLRL